MKRVKLKYGCLIAILLAILLIASPGCSLFKIELNPSDNSSDNSIILSDTPINDSGWNPNYIDDERDDKALSPEEFVEKVSPWVVSILSETVTYDFFQRPYTQKGAGSGIIIDPRGYVVTNYHVVEDATEITVTLYDGRAFKAVNVVGDKQTDLAVIDIGVPLLEKYCAHFLRNSLGQMNLLDEVIAVGNALARGNSWTKGVISQLDVPPISEPNEVVLYDLIQTDAAINPGNSGGPLLNSAGQVIGINVAIAQDYENIGFAISTNTAIPVITNLVKKGHVSRAWLGIRMTTLNQTVKLNYPQYDISVDKGVLIVEVIQDSPAHSAGLQAGDVIIKFDDKKVENAGDLRLAILDHDVGDSVVIDFMRGDEEKTTTVTLGEMPANL
jgi:serine protease Do